MSTHSDTLTHTDHRVVNLKVFIHHQTSFSLLRVNVGVSTSSRICRYEGL